MNLRCRRCKAPLEEADLEYAARWDETKAVQMNAHNKKAEQPECRACYERDVRVGFQFDLEQDRENRIHGS